MSYTEDTTIAESVATALRPVRLQLPIIDIKRLIVAKIRADVALKALLGVTTDDPRVYAYYLPTATVSATQRAYITYAQTSFPEQTQATADPVFNLAVWGIDWEVAEAVRDRLVALFDEKALTTIHGRTVFGTILLQHDNYQENTKFTSVVVQIRFGFSRV